MKTSVKILLGCVLAGLIVYAYYTEIQINEIPVCIQSFFNSLLAA